MRLKINLSPFLSDLQQKKENGETWDELAVWLQEEHNIIYNGHTIQRRFKDIDASFGIINLNLYMDEIMQQREEGVPLSGIIDNLMTQYGIRISERTLQRRFQ